MIAHMNRPLLLLASICVACADAHPSTKQSLGHQLDREQPIEAGWSLVAQLGEPATHALWAAADDDVWIVGGYPEDIDPGFTPGPDPDPTSRLTHFDGLSWTDVASPSEIMLTAVWGSSARDVWVLDAHGKAFHYDGRSWRARPELSGAALGGSSATDVWFGDTREMLHWDGAKAARFPRPEGDFLISIFAFSARDVWAGGGSGALLHWDGAAWSSVASGSTLYNYGLWGAAPDDLWIVGNGGNRLHWDGRALHGEDKGFTGFEAIAGTASDDVWGVGECCWDRGQNLAWASHFDGTRWTDTEFASLQAQLVGITVTPAKTLYALSSAGELIVHR